MAVVVDTLLETVGNLLLSTELPASQPPVPRSSLPINPPADALSVCEYCNAIQQVQGARESKDAALDGADEEGKESSCSRRCLRRRRRRRRLPSIGQQTS